MNVLAFLEFCVNTFINFMVTLLKNLNESSSKTRKSVKTTNLMAEYE